MITARDANMHWLGLVALMTVVGCASPVSLPVSDEKSILKLPPGHLSRFLETLGHPGVYPADVSRSTTGDRLFIQFAVGPQRTYMVAIVTSNNVSVKELPGQSRFDDQGRVLFWGDSREKNLRFSNGTTLPESIDTWHFEADSRFVALFDRKHLWIARVESPLEEIVVIPWSLWVDFIISHKDKLHVFARGQPEGKPRPDGWEILKHFEYRIEGNNAQLVQVQDFDFTWSIQDFDPETGLLFVSSWSDMFAHGILVDTKTGSRKDVRVAGGYGYFLRNEVVQQFLKAIGEEWSGGLEPE